jgi:hypothetical protein
MATPFFKQWLDMGQASLENLKKLTETNTANLSDALHYQMTNADLTQLIKASIQSTQQLSEINSAAFHNLFRNQLNVMQTNISAPAMQEWTDMMTNLTQNFMQQQATLFTDCSQVFNAYLADLQKVHNVEEMSSLQLELYNNLEDKVKNNSSQHIDLLNNMKEAMNTWAEKNLSHSA